jgi:hypothetical protein
MLDPIAGRLAVQEVRNLARSALPGAPVCPVPEPIPARRLRRRSAVALRWLADRLEPTPRQSRAEIRFAASGR